MQARCPHCRNVFPTERTGVQFCPHCGREIDVPAGAPTSVEPPASFQPPAEPLPPGGAAGPVPQDTVPWERRRELGFFNALWQTWKGSMFAPSTFWPRVRPAGPPVDALLFAWILYGFAKVLAIPFVLLQPDAATLEQILQQSAVQDPRLSGVLEQVAHLGGLASLGMLAVTALLFPVFLVIAAAILHLFALLFGTGKNGYWATFRVVAYASSPLVFSFYGCLSTLAFLYAVVLTILGLTRVQDTSAGKATATVLTPFVASCFCCCAGVALLGMGVAAAVGGAHP
jgi:hypothetical protein